MTKQEKIELLEEIMDIEPGTLALENELSEFDEWDSLTALSYITTMDEKFHKNVSGEQIKAFVTVADAIELMG